jgi:hypothetical protein
MAISIFGSISSAGHDLIQDICHTAGRAIPSSLLPAASWAAPELAPFTRMALGVAVRRGLAAAIRAHRSSAADLDLAAPASGPTPAPPSVGPAPVPDVAPAPVPGPPLAALSAALWGTPG